jgi:hypothetical protein
MAVAKAKTADRTRACQARVRCHFGVVGLCRTVIRDRRQVKNQVGVVGPATVELPIRWLAEAVWKDRPKSVIAT